MIRLIPNRLPRKLSTRYLGWKDRGMKLALDFARRMDREIVIPESVFTPRDINRSEKSDPRATEAYAQMKRFCDKEGLSLEEEKVPTGDLWFRIKRKT